MSNSERRVIEYVEIDLPLCSLTYGVSPCTAALDTAGEIKCFNTLNTCQDRPAYDPEDNTFRFSRPNTYLPKGIEAIPCLASVSFTPAVVSLGGDLGTRATLAVSFTDFPWSDPGDEYDKYPGDRNYDPYQQGSYWGKFRARHPFVRGKILRWKRGFATDDLGDLETRTYIIDSFDGPNQNGVYTIYARDVLKIADNKRSQAPLLSEGFLSGSLTDVATSATLNPTGIGNEKYATSGIVAIGGEELCDFTRSGDDLTLTRGQYGTVAVAHDASDRVQEVLEYDGIDPALIIQDLLENYAGIDSSYIPIASWQIETAAYLGRDYSALIAEPTSVRDLVSELIEQACLALWWDDETSTIQLRVLRTIGTETQVFSEDDIIEGSLTIHEQPETRKSQVWVYYGQRNALEPIDEPDNYRSTLIEIDADAESDQGSPAIKKIYCRWVPAFGSSVADRLAAIQIGRFKTPPRRFSFSVYKHGGAIVPALGEGCQLRHPVLQDETGAQVNVPVQITRFNPLSDRIDVEAQEMLFDFDEELETATRTITISSDEQEFNLRDAHDAIFPDPEPQTGTPEYSIVCNVLENVIVGSNSPTTPAFDVGDWPAGIPILVNNLGRIQGCGGNGGDAGTTMPDGGQGGTAFYTRVNVDLDLGSGDGMVYGGGGGGGGATDNDGDGVGGGGGAGRLGGTGGTGQVDGEVPEVHGQDGTLNAGGAGGYIPPVFPDVGGDGGGPGLAGENATGGIVANTGSGGAAGYAIDGVSYVTFVSTGSGDIRGGEVN